MNKRRTLTSVASMTLAAAMLAACAVSATPSDAPVTAKVTREQAIEMAQAAMAAYNDGDFAAYSESWSPEMKAAIDETAFLSFREALMAARGRFRSIDGVELRAGSEPGYIRYVFTATFEHGPVEFALGFEADGELITGAHILSPS